MLIGPKYHFKAFIFSKQQNFPSCQKSPSPFFTRKKVFAPTPLFLLKKVLDPFFIQKYVSAPLFFSKKNSTFSPPFYFFQNSIMQSHEDQSMYVSYQPERLFLITPCTNLPSTPYLVFYERISLSQMRLVSYANEHTQKSVRLVSVRKKVFSPLSMRPEYCINFDPSLKCRRMLNG